MTQKAIWTVPISPEEINRRARGTLSDHLGIRFIRVEPNALVAEMPVQEFTFQPMGILHGGASAALAETVASAAANYCIDPSQKVCVGMELNINHLKSVRSGVLTATAKPFHLGSTTQVWEIQIRDETERLIAISRLTLAVINNIPLVKKENF